MNHALLDGSILVAYLIVAGGALYNIALGLITFRKRLRWTRQKRHAELLRVNREYRRNAREAEKAAAHEEIAAASR